jgi:hypothetical protein
MDLVVIHDCNLWKKYQAPFFWRGSRHAILMQSHKVHQLVEFFYLVTAMQNTPCTALTIRSKLTILNFSDAKTVDKKLRYNFAVSDMPHLFLH